MKRICVESVKEMQNGGKEYVMAKISISNKETFGICILGDKLAFESLGNDCAEAEERFDLISRNRVSEAHLEDVLHDIKMKMYF